MLWLRIRLLAAIWTSVARGPWAAAAQGQGQGSNYDPPLRSAPKPPPPPTQVQADRPLLEIQELDWADKSTWLKAALLVGSLLLVLRAFRQMKHNDEED